MLDNYRHKGKRQKLVTELRNKGIQDEKILEAILNIPRHYFLDKAFEDWAYRDVAFPIEANQTISQPFTVAMQTQLLEILPGEKILEIGTGSGYQATVLAYLKAKVYTIERQRDLFLRTSKLLPKMGYSRIRTLFGDGYQGSPRFAPFDKILVTAAAREVPKALLQQLKVGGLLVIPVGHSEVQEMLRISKVGGDEFRRERFGQYSFVPMLKGTARA